MRDRLAIHDDPGERQGQDGGGDRHHFGGPIAAVAAPQPHLVTVLMRDDPEAVMLQLVDPARSDRHYGEDRLARMDEPGRLAPVPGET